MLTERHSFSRRKEKRNSRLSRAAVISAATAIACLIGQTNASAAGLPHNRVVSAAVKDAAATTLSYTLGSTGLTSLTNNGTAFFTSTNNGALAISQSPIFQPVSGASYYGSSTPLSTSLNSQTQTVTVAYAWGTLACQYTQSGNTLNMRYTVTNTTNDLMTTVPIRLPEMTFPITPTGNMTDNSAYADDTPPLPLYYSNFWADPRYRPAVLMIDYGTAGTVALSNEDVASMARITDYGSDNPSAFTRYPFYLNMRPVQGGDSMSCTISLRFGAAGATITDVAGDLLQKYSALFPRQLEWDDRRSIGALFLANHGGGAAYPLNPRGWFSDPALDLTTPAGYPVFRQRLMNYADGAVAEMKSMNSQGMLIWDLEGEQYPQPITYIGDPRILGQLAPEMEYVDSSGVATVDAFFQKFKDAGFTTGLLIRPQQIAFNAAGAPNQNDLSQPTKTLLDKITYARNRWGVKIFHIDTFAAAGPSDSDTLPSFDRGNGALDPGILEQIASIYPDTLLIPEWKTTRSYAYSAPFTSVELQEGTITEPSIRAVYPGGFVCDLDRVGDHGIYNLLVSGLQTGDLLMYDGWFDDEPGNSSVMSMYQTAGAPPVAHLTSPVNGAVFPDASLLRSGTRMLIQATASASPGKSISKVEFFQTTITGGTVKIGQATSAPYSIVWTNAPNGAYVLSVTATDSSGLTRTPATQTVIVGAISYSFTDAAGNDAPISGLHFGIDFGTGKWRSNNDFAGTKGQVAYDDYQASTANGKTFNLPAGRFLRSITLTSHRADTYTISDGVNPPITGVLSPNVAVTITPQWRGGGRTITLTTANVASSGISNISY